MMKCPWNTARANRATRILTLGLLLVTMAGCASSGDQVPVLDQARVIEAQRAADAAEAQRAAQERSRMEAAEVERARQEALVQAEAARAAELVRVQREEESRQAAAAQERREAQAREQAQRDRIAALEAQIAELRDSTSNVSAANARLGQAIDTAEELLRVLTAEQLKYGNNNAAGEPVEALEKELIADLEARKESLKQEAQALVGQ